MINFFKKVDLAPLLKVDFHSHILPNLDDGAANIDDSLRMIQEFLDLGYRKIITTPHIKKDKYENTPKGIQDALLSLKAILKEKEIDVDIIALAEYYCDAGFLEYIKNDDILHLNHFVLFEFSYMIPPPNLEEIIYELKVRDYIPVLAHPERYSYFHNKLDRYEYLKNLGVYFQVNLNSLAGHYARPAQKTLKYLSKKGFIDFVGSDAHHQEHIEILRKVMKSREFTMLFQENNILNNIFLEESL
ncbi:MAG: capsular biosynthesis protein [Campylobacterales bacterium]|nr:capsular biosynthesis protein [Campylobacterales bacterium]